MIFNIFGKLLDIKRRINIIDICLLREISIIFIDIIKVAAIYKSLNKKFDISKILATFYPDTSFVADFSVWDSINKLIK